MSKVITLRPSDSEHKVITELMKHYGVSTATKALIKASKDVPVMNERLDRLDAQLKESKDEVYKQHKILKKLKDVIKTIMSVNDF